MKLHFENQFYDNILELLSFEGDRSPINVPINLEEIQCTIKTLKNSLVTGPDEIAAQQVK